MSDRQLPEAFQDLEAHLEWALATEHERRAKRATSPMTHIKTFYDTMLPRMDEVLTHLSAFPADHPPPEVLRLFLLATALAEIAPAVEMYGEPTAEGMDVLRLTPIDIYPAKFQSAQ